MRTDFLLDDDFDLIDDGDEWLEGESDQQHVELLVLFEKGQLREFPFVGFGIERRLKSVADPKRFNRELKVELENDGYNSANIIVNDNLSDFKIEL
ncbi:hypothetical protein D3C78_1448320 [compost metagenome]